MEQVPLVVTRPPVIDRLQTRDWDSLTTTDLAQLASAFMPRFVHADDEPYWPMSFPAYLDGAELQYAGVVLASPSNDGLPRLTPGLLAQYTTEEAEELIGHSVELEEGKRRDLRLVMDDQKYVQTKKSFGEVGEDVPVYVRVRLLGDEVYEVLYCVFYPRNAPYQVCGCCPVGYHQADWEHVTVRVSKADPTRILNMRFSGHGSKDGYWVSGDPSANQHVHLVPGTTTRPLVFVARGAHAMYHEPGSYWRICGFANDNAPYAAKDAVDGNNRKTYRAEGWDPEVIVLLGEPGSKPTPSEDDRFTPPWLRWDGYHAPDDEVDQAEKPFRGRITHLRRNKWWRKEVSTSNNWCRRVCCWWCGDDCLTTHSDDDMLGYLDTPEEMNT